LKRQQQSDRLFTGCLAVLTLRALYLRPIEGKAPCGWLVLEVGSPFPREMLPEASDISTRQLRLRLLSIDLFHAFYQFRFL
jgi:hypothetical protein